MSKITYENKEQLNTNENIPAKNKCMASDLNEIKEVVNENDANALYNTNVKTIKTDSDTDVYGCNYVNNAIKKHIVTAICTTDWGQNTSNKAIVPFNKTNIIGTKLSYNSSDNSIIIGNGVSKILVSANAVISATNSNTGDVIELDIIKNNSISNAVAIGVRANKWLPLGAGNVPIDVQEGDKIQLQVWNNTTKGIAIYNNSCYLTVEVIE